MVAKEMSAALEKARLLDERTGWAVSIAYSVPKVPGTAPITQETYNLSRRG
jgi:hypothetical protein